MGVVPLRKSFTITDSFRDLLKRQRYEELVLKIINKSEKLLKNLPLYKIEEQSNGECDFKNQIGEKYEVKLLIDTKQGALIGDRKNDLIEWINSMTDEVDEYSKCIQKRDLSYVSYTKLYCIMTERLKNVEKDEISVLFSPYPLVDDCRNSIFLQFASDFLQAVFDRMIDERNVLCKDVYFIYPSMEPNIVVLRNAYSRAREYIYEPEMSQYLRYEAYLSPNYYSDNNCKFRFMKIEKNNEFINLIKYSIYGGEIPVISDWEELSQRLIRHAIVPILWTGDRVNNYSIPDDIMEKLSQIRMMQMRNFIRIQTVTNELTDILTEAGTQPIILKGFAAAKYYQNPMLRTFGDIDFLIRGELSFDDAKKLLIQNGYVETEDEKDPEISYMRHDGLKRNGVSLEIHRFFSHKENELDEEIDSIIDAAEVEEVSLGTCRFYTLKDSANGLVLIDHINHHLMSGLGLRQIIDWLYYVETTLTDELWRSEFEAFVKRTGLEALAITVTHMCEMYLGLSHREFAEAADDMVCELLMNEIIEAGNFGCNRDGVVSQIAQFANTKNYLARLQEGGLARWKAAQKHKCLRPFAWLYQAFRIAGIMIGRLFNGKSVKGAGELAERQDKLFRELKIGKYR